MKNYNLFSTSWVDGHETWNVKAIIKCDNIDRQKYNSVSATNNEEHDNLYGPKNNNPRA